MTGEIISSICYTIAERPISDGILFRPGCASRCLDDICRPVKKVPLSRLHKAIGQWNALRLCSRRAIRPSHIFSTFRSFYTPSNMLSSLWGRPEGGGLFGTSQWRQQTRRFTRFCPQRDVRGTRRALEAEVQGEVDRARRSAGGGIIPAPSLCHAPDIEQGDLVASAAQLGRQHTTKTSRLAGGGSTWAVEDRALGSPRSLSPPFSSSNAHGSRVSLIAGRGAHAG